MIDRAFSLRFFRERTNMKRLLVFLAVVLLLIAAGEPLLAMAAGDPDMDSGGGTWGHAAAGFTWRDGDDGVRVTIIDAQTGNPVSRSIDISNIDTSDIVLHFGKVSKSAYRNGATLQALADEYMKYTPAVPLPKLVNAPDQAQALLEIKSYFTDEQVLRRIASHVGMNYENMISGAYKVMVEPMAYAEIQGIRTALTATEAALYNAKTGGLLKRKMPSLTHKNLPLALFLEHDDAGFLAWTGSKTEKVSDDDIIAYLGIGTVRFREEPDITPTPVVIDAPDYVYRTDTDVITAVTVSGGMADPDHPVSVRFRILGRDYWATNIYYPKDGQQLVWVSWHTPVAPQRVEVSVWSERTVSKTVIKCDIEELKDNPPPNPVADDQNPGWSRGRAVPPSYERTSASWTVWKCRWHPNLVWEADWKWQEDRQWVENLVWVPDLQWVEKGHLPSCPRWCTKKHGWWEDRGNYEDQGYWEDQGRWVDKGRWGDHGWWDHYLEYYSATLGASATLSPDENSPTAYGNTLKSGYGVTIQVSGNVYRSSNAAATGAQNAISYFPEFYYATYWRLLDRLGGGRFCFKVNPYSTLGARTHFTPIWMPDGDYIVSTTVFDAWTPVGMLSKNATAGVTISGNLWDDWHIAPVNPD